MNDTANLIKVGIADLNVVRAPGKIRTAGLGSCVGIVLYDKVRRIAGMAHIMLPDSTMAKQTLINRSKYADTAIDDLIQRLEAIGGTKYRLKAKLAGGAQMFQFSTANDMMRIGPRNVQAVKEKLSQLRISIESEDVGGKSGRTIEFDTNTGMLKIRTVHKGESLI